MTEEQITDALLRQVREYGDACAELQHVLDSGAKVHSTEVRDAHQKRECTRSMLEIGIRSLSLQAHKAPA